MLLKKNIFAFLINLIIPYLLILTMHEPSQALLLWPAIGLGVISALVWGYKIIPALYLSQLLCNYLLYPENDNSTHDLLINHTYIIIGIVRNYIGAYLIRFFISYPNSMISKSSILKFYLIIGPLIALISTTLSSLAHYIFSTNIISSTFISHFTDWWFGDYVGFIIFAPLLLAFIAQPQSIWKPRQLTLVFPTMIFLCFIIFTYNKTDQTDKIQIQSYLKVKTELITTKINQEFIAISDLLISKLQAISSQEDFNKQLHSLIKTYREINSNDILHSVIYIENEKLIEYYKLNKIEDNKYEFIKKYDYSSLASKKNTKLFANYFEDSKLFSHTIDTNHDNIKIVVFYDVIKYINQLIKAYSLQDSMIALVIPSCINPIIISSTREQKNKFTALKSTLNFNKQKWTLSFQPTHKYFSKHSANSNSILVKIGFISTGFLSMLLLIITGKTTLTSIKVKERTLVLDTKINQFKDDKKQYQKLIENHPVVLWNQSINTNKITYISKKVKDIYGYDKNLWCSNKNFRLDHVFEDDRIKTLNAINSAIANRIPFELEYRFIRADSSIAWVKDVVSFNNDEHGNAQLVGLMIDTTETHEAKKNQSISESKYRTLFRFTSNPLIIIDLDSCLFKDYNDKTIELFGMNEIAGNLTLSDLSPIKQPDGSVSKRRLSKIYNLIQSNENYQFEWAMNNYAHKQIICDIELTKLPETKHNLVLASITDITEKKLHDKKIYQLAYYDKLTTLPNREYFYTKFDFFHQLAKEKKSYGTIIYLDLDRFKLLNDSLGHQAGDKLLKMVGKRIKKSSKNSDFCARLGGDEFIILTRILENDIETALENSLIKSELILEALNEPFQLGDYEHFITPSIGISVYPHMDASIDDIIHQADIAMYASKEKSKNTITVFQNHMVKQVAKKLHLEKAVKEAFDKNEFNLHYQIKVDENKNITSAESLLRWDRLKEFNINTEKLVQTIDTVGLTNELGHWVLDKACAQLEQWNNKNTIKSLAINISPIQMKQKLFVNQIINVINNYSINPTQITLELTESNLIDNREILVTKLQKLREYGVKISLDDFGTGYSSLAYIQKLPIDQLKIDKMFITNLTTDNSSQHVVNTIIALANWLNIELIVEGIETEQQFNILKSLGVKNFQGFYFAKALPAELLS